MIEKRGNSFEAVQKKTVSVGAKMTSGSRLFQRRLPIASYLLVVNSCLTSYNITEIQVYKRNPIGDHSAVYVP